MKIRILGTRANVDLKADKHQNRSGILVDDKLLFDLGEPQFLELHPDCLIFTHFHPDHAYFMWDKEALKTDIRCYAPEKHRLAPHVNILTQPLKIEGYEITPVPTIHSLNAKSQGYIVEKGGKRFFYSGDVAWIEKKERKAFGQLNLVITDGSYIRKGGLVLRDKDSSSIYGHTGIPNLINLFKDYTQHIAFVHLGKWFIKDPSGAPGKLKKLEEKGIKLELAYDGQELEI